MASLTGADTAFRLDRPGCSLLQYPAIAHAAEEETMPSISPELLQSISRDLSRVPLDPADAAGVAAGLGAQLDGLARLDDLDLMAVEPATVLLPPTEAPDARQ
jgi:ABC-type antimicrobial peptide transport system permease subunit